MPSDNMPRCADDLYVFTTLPRARAARDVLAGEVEAVCGIASNHGKGCSDGSMQLRLKWMNLVRLCGKVTKRDTRYSAFIGHLAFVQAWAAGRLQEEKRVLPDLCLAQAFPDGRRRVCKLCGNVPLLRRQARPLCQAGVERGLAPMSGTTRRVSAPLTFANACCCRT